MRYFLIAFLLLFPVMMIRADDYVPGQVMLQLEYKTSQTIQEISSELAETDLEPIRELSSHLRIWLCSFRNRGRSDLEILEAISAHPAIHAAQFNHYVELRNTYPDDPEFGEQWALENTGQSGGLTDADIDAPEAWDVTTQGVTVLGDTIIVAVVDSGFELTHEDLNFWKNWHEIPDNDVDDDENGYIDDYDGWNACAHNGNITNHYHGTHVTGITAALGNNAQGVTGVNWNMKVMPVLAASETEAVVVEGYGYVYAMRALYQETAGDSGAFVVVTNSSFGVNFGDPEDYPIWCAMYDSLGALGILSATATMNIDANVDLVGDMPTACPSPYLIAVTNTTDEDLLNGFAAWGPVSIDLGAPGTHIMSTELNNSYTYHTGTSMSSPHVAGAVAFLYAAASEGLLELYLQQPDSVALIIKDCIMNGVDEVASLQDITVTGGRLNLNNAVQLLPEIQGNGNEVSGEIMEDTVWSADTVLVVGDVTVVDSVTLAIEPGVRVEFQGNYSLEIQGRLLAIGTETDSIYFTCNDSLVANWGGISFNSTPAENDSSFISYCVIEKGLADGSDLEGCGGGIMVNNFSKIKFSNCRISDNIAFDFGGGIYLNNASLILENCAIINNFAISGAQRKGGGVALFNSDPFFESNLFHNNYAAVAGGGLYIDFSGPALVNNTIDSNFSADYGGGIYCSNSYPFLLKNHISNNFSYNGDAINQGGGFYMTTSTPWLINNLINNNTANEGGGFYCWNSNPYFTNNTLGGNSTVGTNGRGGGCFFGTDSVYYNASFINTILYNNTSGLGAQVYYNDEFCYSDFYYSSLEGGVEAFGMADSTMIFSGTYDNCHDYDPCYCGEGEHPYSLQLISLCINAGTPDTTGLDLPSLDLAGNPRIYNGTSDIIDLGAYEYQGEPVDYFPEPVICSAPVLFNNYPNPFNPETVITFQLQQESRVSLEIFNVRGQKVKTLINDNIMPGLHQVVWDGTDQTGEKVSSGIYLYRLIAGKYNNTKKMILIK